MENNVTNKKLIPKLVSYGTNFLTPSVIGALKNLPREAGAAGNNFTGLSKLSDSANPFGALAFGTLDVVSHFSDKVRESKFNRLAKFGGLVWYGGNVVKDIFDIGRGYYPAFADLFFDGLMVYQLGKDTVKNYQGKGKDLLEDINFWK